MNDFMLEISGPKNHRRINHVTVDFDKVFIQLVDFQTIDEAKELEKPEIFKKLVKILFPAVEEKYAECMVYRIDDFIKNIVIKNRKESIYNRILLGTYIIKDSNREIRLIQNTDLSIHKLIPTRIIKIPVYERKDDVLSNKGSKENNSLIDPFIYYKKISGNIIFVKQMEKSISLSLEDIIHQSSEINKDISIENLGFLIEYHDCPVSTVEYVENFFENITENHASVMISGKNRVFAVESTEHNELICLSDLSKLTIESIILS